MFGLRAIGRMSLKERSLNLYDPRVGFVLTAKADNRLKPTVCGRQFDIKGPVLFLDHLKDRERHIQSMALPSSNCTQAEYEYLPGRPN
jgi:hypothetical protein